ncbi:MAG: lytic transglycosylase domain-containing protein, partial [Deltaproteobacteria bacterium]|nr:lytic transglycosylase domain-containing protein [Deltaproteobacteria bacterium]
NPHQNISGGVRYFKQLMNQFDGDVKLALAAYNAGSRNVRQYKGIPPFKSTRCYIDNVFKYYRHYKSRRTGGPDRV